MNLVDHFVPIGYAVYGLDHIGHGQSEGVREYVGKLRFIVVKGATDRLVDPSGTQMLYDAAGSEDKAIKIYDGLYHRVFNEPERYRVLTDVDNWLRSRLTG